MLPKTHHKCCLFGLAGVRQSSGSREHAAAIVKVAGSRSEHSIGIGIGSGTKHQDGRNRSKRTCCYRRISYGGSGEEKGASGREAKQGG